MVFVSRDEGTNGDTDRCPNMNALLSLSLAGKSGICVSRHFHHGVCDEDNSVRILAAPDRVPAERMELAGLHDRHDRVRTI